MADVSPKGQERHHTCVLRRRGQVQSEALSSILSYAKPCSRTHNFGSPFPVWARPRTQSQIIYPVRAQPQPQPHLQPLPMPMRMPTQASWCYCIASVLGLEALRVGLDISRVELCWLQRRCLLVWTKITTSGAKRVLRTTPKPLSILAIHLADSPCKEPLRDATTALAKKPIALNVGQVKSQDRSRY